MNINRIYIGTFEKKDNANSDIANSDNGALFGELLKTFKEMKNLDALYIKNFQMNDKDASCLAKLIKQFIKKIVTSIFKSKMKIK